MPEAAGGQQLIQKVERQPAAVLDLLGPGCDPRRHRPHCVEHPKRDRVWWTTPGQVADFCYALPPGTIPGEGP